MLVEHEIYSLSQYKREKYGKFWRAKTYLLIISPSAYSEWVGGKMVIMIKQMLDNNIISEGDVEYYLEKLEYEFLYSKRMQQRKRGDRQ